MKFFLNSLIFFVLLNVINGQVTQIIVTSIEQTDKTFNKKDKLFLKNQATKNQIIYTIDTLTKNLTTKKYLVETFYSIWDGDTITKTKIKQKYKKMET